MSIDKLIRQYESDQSLENGLLVAKELRRLGRVEEIGLYLDAESMGRYGFVTIPQAALLNSLELINEYIDVPMNILRESMVREAVPFFIRILGSNSALNRRGALMALEKVSPDTARQVIPELLSRESNLFVLRIIEYVIGNLRIKPDMGTRFFYHVSPRRHRASIMREGLIPQIGPRSQALGEKNPTIFLFQKLGNADEALDNWLYEEIEETEGEGAQIDLYKISLPVGFPVLPTFEEDYERIGVSWEFYTHEKIPPQFITLIRDVYR